MKRLDRFSRFENGAYYVVFFLFFFGPVWLVVDVFDSFVKDESLLIKIPLWLGGTVVGTVAGFFVTVIMGSLVESAFKGFRNLWGMKPLRELEEEVRTERRNAEDKQEEGLERQFMHGSADERLYKIWSLQRRQAEILRAFGEKLNTIQTIVFMLICLAVGYLLIKRLF